MHTKKENMMKLERLQKRSDFLYANTKGQKWVSHGLIIQIVPRDHDVIRTGFTVTKRTEKSAVKRNRIKRRLRAVAADVLSHVGRTGYDYVLIGRSATLTRPYDALCRDLKWCLKKMKHIDD